MRFGPIYWLNALSNVCYYLFSVNNVIYHPDEFVDANNIPRTYTSLANQNFTWVDWVLTTKPGYFGIIPGTANPTGVGLLVILLIMYICSMKWVRKGGYFEVICIKESLKPCRIYVNILSIWWYHLTLRNVSSHLRRN